MNNLISVIVPVYNAEKYIDRCLNSIVNQTYKNLEVILVDDGSTDNSKKIYDRFQKEDNRIKVIYQNNKGASAARNLGIIISKGEYISFVDADDWVDLKYFEILYNNLIKNNADISCCDNLRTSKHKSVFSNISKIYILDSTTNILKFYLEKELTSPWAKLYNKKFWKNNRFPIGKTNEDIFTIFKVFFEAKKVVYSNEKLYYYFKNPTSTTKSKFTKKNLDLLFAWNKVVKISKFSSEDVKELANFRLQKGYFSLLGIIAYYGIENTEKNMKIKKVLLKQFKKIYSSLLKSDLISFNKKLAIIFMIFNFEFCCSIGKVIRKIKKYNFYS